MSSLIDTDVIIDALHGDAGMREYLEQRATSGLMVSMISIGELIEGAYLTTTPEAHIADVRTFLAGYTIIGLDDRVMDAFGRERARLRRLGQRIADLDLLIAATAVAHDLALVTRNRRHFERIDGLQLVDDLTR